MPWNGRPRSAGMGAHHPVETPPTIAWNTQQPRLTQKTLRGEPLMRHWFETVLFEMPFSPMACPISSSRRVETSLIPFAAGLDPGGDTLAHIAAPPPASAPRCCGPRGGPEISPLSKPRHPEVQRAQPGVEPAIPYPLRQAVRAPLHSCQLVPIRPLTSFFATIDELDQSLDARSP